jgi:GT2 family glycosyltransferase
MLVRSEAWDLVGGMDARFYPVLFADVDLCTAVRASGRRIAIAPLAMTRHIGSASTRRPYAQFLGLRNRTQYDAKWVARRPLSIIDPRIPRDLLESVARAAAATLDDLAVRYVEAVDLSQQTARLEGELDAIRDSTSWRVTVPFRYLTARFRRTR